MAEVVTADSLAKAYGETDALVNATVHVEAGEVYALIGPNGAGKSTLVRCLLGTLEPSGGSARLFGHPPTDVAADRIGYLPQSFTPHERLTVHELVAYYAGLYSDPRPVDDVLADVGLTAATDTRYESLSGGQQRRLCVGISLINDPDVLFLDEPTTGIDPAGRRDVWRLVESLADDGTTVVLTTHYMEEAEVLADHVGILVEGELVDEGAPDRLIERYVGDAHLSVEVASELDADALADAPFDVTVLGSRLEFEGVPAVELPAVLEYLDELGVTLTDVSWSEPTLDDVYLRAAESATLPTPWQPHLDDGDREGER